MVGGPRRERASFKHLGELRHLLVYLRRYGWILTIAITGILISNVMSAVIPLMMKEAIDSLADEALEPNIVIPALAIAAIVVVRFFVFVVTVF